MNSITHHVNNESENVTHNNETISENDSEGSRDIPSSPQVIAINPRNEQQDQDEDITAPPPSYWSIHSANNIQEGPGIGNEVHSSHTLTIAPPPAYHTLFGQDVETNNSNPAPSEVVQVQNSSEADQEPATTRSTTKTVVIAYLILVFGFTLPIIMIVIGTLKLDDCPMASGIPTILIISAIFQMLEGLWTYKRIFRTNNRNRQQNSSVWMVFLLFWIIGFNITMFRFKPDFSNSNSGYYCDPLLYHFSLAILALYDAILGSGILFIIGSVLYKAISKRFQVAH